MEEKDQSNHTCLNCGNNGSGTYCDNCGQKFSNLNRPVKDLLNELYDTFNLDKRLLKTFIPFIIRPGHLALEYLAGRRKSYTSPLRLYLIMSLIFFFLAQATSRKMIDNSDEGVVRLNSDSTGQKVVMDKNEALELLKNDTVFFGEKDSTTSVSALRQVKRQRKLQQALIKAISDQSLFVKSLYKNISYVLFILMPAFALILKLLYIRRKRLYIEHLVFALNMHSFALLVLSLIITLKYLFPDVGDGFLMMLIVMPVYFTAGMHRFYGQGWFKTIFKEIILTFIYWILLVVSLLVLLVGTLYYF